MSLSDLLAGEPPPLQHRRHDGAANVLLTCDHASNLVPRALAGLGLAEPELRRHIAWDIGAANVTRRLAARLDAPAILAGYSRLVIDCNRDPADTSSIPETSDGVAIPGQSRPFRVRARRTVCLNLRALPRGDRGMDRGAAWARRRCRRWFRSTASRRSWAARRGRGMSASCGTAIRASRFRCWRRSRADPALVVGDNEPYSAREPQGYTVRHHAVSHGLPHVAIELRQDLIEDDAGAARWAEILAAALAPILARADLYRTGG